LTQASRIRFFPLEASFGYCVYTDTNNSVFFLFTDHLGSTNVTSDPNGLMVSLSLYMPWGESRGGVGTTLTDYGFTGQRKEESIGLQYFNARWYDSYLVILCKWPSAIIYGFNFSGSAVGIYNNAGAEELIMFSDLLNRAVFTYRGEGQNILPGGGSYSVYGGVVYNLQDPRDYNGNFASVGYTESAGEGTTGAFFWDASKSPDDTSAVQGYYFGTAPGVQASIFTSVTNYNMAWPTEW
jgi:hypothetical protein